MLLADDDDVVHSERRDDTVDDEAVFEDGRLKQTTFTLSSYWSELGGKKSKSSFLKLALDKK